MREKPMKYIDERMVPRLCAVKACRYHDHMFEGSCCADDENGDPAIGECPNYLPAMTNQNEGATQ